MQSVCKFMAYINPIRKKLGFLLLYVFFFWFLCVALDSLCGSELLYTAAHISKIQMLRKKQKFLSPLRWKQFSALCDTEHFFRCYPVFIFHLILL